MRTLGARIVLVDSQPQSGNSASTATAADHLSQRSQIEDPQDFRLSDRVVQLSDGDHPGEVQQRVGKGRTGNAVHLRPVLRGQVSVPMCGNPGR